MDTSIPRLIFVLIVVGILVSIIVLISKREAGSKARNENELRDTLRWMSDSIVSNSPYDSMAKVVAMSSQGCSVEIKTVPVKEKEGTVLQYMFDLRDIDLRSIIFDDGLFIASSISFRKGLNIRNIMVNGGRGHSMFFDLNKEYGPTFVKAFKRAVTLCGGE
jgi:hypothetical protein